MPGLSIALVSPPLCKPSIPNLAVETLAQVARGRGHRVATLHGALCQTRYFRNDLIHGLGAPACFTPLYGDLDVDPFVADLVDAVFRDFGQRERVPDSARPAVGDRFFFGVFEAERTIERVLERIPAGCDVIGLSVGFDSQKVPAAVLARRLRERGETATIVVGGTGTDDEMGPALLERFAELDLVLRGEADESWPLLLDRLAAGAGPGDADALGDVPGLVARAHDTIVSVPERPVSTAFQDLPAPDYTSFIDQLRASDYAGDELCLLVETSRGCWWGRKHHCTFCGIRSVDDEYRHRPAEDAAALLTEVYDRYAPDVLYCTDAIAPATYHATAWPHLYKARSEGRPWRIFYETKSNLKRREIARMAAAGIVWVQPGIESFSTPCLRAMDKGATALQQVAFVKWAHAYGIRLVYGVISGMPPERAEHLRGMARLFPKLHHLPPPDDVNRLVLHRFSPHFASPGHFGMAEVVPFHTQHVIYQCERPLLDRLLYQLDFRVPAQQTDDYEAARDELVLALEEWRQAFLAGAGLWVRAQGDIRVVGRARTAGELDVEVLSDPTEVLVLDECAERRSVPRLAHERQADTDGLWAAVRRLEDRGLMIRDGDEALSLPIVPDLDPAQDAHWTSRQLIPPLPEPTA